MDIFKFEISDKLRIYKKNSLNLEVTLKTNNFKLYLEELNNSIAEMDKSQKEILRIVTLFSKGRYHIKPDMASAEKNQLMIELNALKNKFIKVHPEKEKLITDQTNKFLEHIILAITNHIYEKTFELLEDFLSSIVNFNNKKKDMCEKLKLLEDKVLKAICFFDENGFRTHFTKYYLNLEHFADTLHDILSLEVAESLVKDYQLLEKKHFDLMTEYQENSNTSLSKLDSINHEIFENYQKIETYNYIFLKAQVRYERIRLDVGLLVQDQLLLSKKFKEIYSEMNRIFSLRNLHEKYNIKIMFLFSLNIFYEMNQTEFLAFNSSSLPQLFLDASKIKKNEIRPNIMFSNLELIEPEITDRIKKNIIHEFKNKEQYEICDYSGSFLIRKAKKNIFDNNQFYSHELAIFAFMPDEVSQTLNRFMRSSGYDKVFVNQYNVRQRMEVFSMISGINLNCDIYLSIANYQINQQSYTLKKIA